MNRPFAAIPDHRGRYVVGAMLHGVRQAPIYPDLGGHRLRPRRPLHLSDADRVPASALRAQVSESSYTNPSSKRAVSGVRQFVYRWMTFCPGSRSSTSRTSWPMSIRYSDSSSRWNAFSRAGSNPKTEPPSLLKSRYRAHPPRPELWSHRRGAGVDLPARACPRRDTMKLVVLGAAGGTGIEIVRQDPVPSTVLGTESGG
jgi:hypothetical protein